MRLRGKKSEFLTISEALKSEGEKTQPCGLRKHNQEILAHEVGGEKSSEIGSSVITVDEILTGTKVGAGKSSK